MTTLNAYMIMRYDGYAADFGEGDGYFVSQNVAEFLRKSSAACSDIDNTEIWWRNSVAGVNKLDLVCYVLNDISDSIVAKHMNKGQSLASQVGNSVWSPKDHSMISEVYLGGAKKYSAKGNLQQRDRVLAIAIIHELMHNKLDLYPYKKGKKGFVKNLHKSLGKVASTGITYSGSYYNDVDVDLMAAGLHHKIAQFTKG